MIRHSKLSAIVFENLGISKLKMGEGTVAEESDVKSLALKSDQVRSLLDLPEIRVDQRNHVETRDIYQRYRAVCEHNAQSLWICNWLAGVIEGQDDEASCVLKVRNVVPSAPKYQEYAGSLAYAG
ncbi:MAG: hypothetical protein CMP98_00610 [Gammaproteobacteria bacterium]|nr:hypothetical protein [Gammaproteobacteria bacterium]OUU11937.1 MAG: hypothetical protein CBB94_00720 [Gammaproteobacteria bacterium TMED34]|tara:strand:- start:485 stop:859 length:375 start_codon:yes stop_codon:yes gene_type:complete